MAQSTESLHVWLKCDFTYNSTQNRSFWRRFTEPISRFGMEKTKPNTTHTKLKPGLVAVYDIWPGNGAGPFSKFSEENISKGGDKLRKNWRKRTSGKAHDINKQTTYIALKSKIELRAHYATRSLHGAIVSLQSHDSILLHLTGGSLRREPSIEVNTQTISATLFSRDCEL